MSARDVPAARDAECGGIAAGAGPRRARCRRCARRAPIVRAVKRGACGRAGAPPQRARCVPRFGRRIVSSPTACGRAARAGFAAKRMMMLHGAALSAPARAARARPRRSAVRRACAVRIAARPSALEEAILVRPYRLRYDRPLIAAQPSRRDGRSCAVRSFAGPESADRRHRQLAFSSNNNDPPVREAARAARHEAPL